MWFLLFFSQKLCIIYFPSDSSSFVLSAESFSFDLKMNFRAPITSYIPCFFHVLIYPSTWKKPRFEIRFHERFNSAPRNGLCPWNDEKVDGSNVIVSRLLAFVLEYVRKVWKYATEKSRRLLTSFEEILHDPLKTLFIIIIPLSEEFWIRAWNEILKIFYKFNKIACYLSWILSTRKEHRAKIKIYIHRSASYDVSVYFPETCQSWNSYIITR